MKKESAPETQSFSDAHLRSQIRIGVYVRFSRPGEAAHKEGYVVDWFSKDGIHHYPKIELVESHRETILDENCYVEGVWDSKPPPTPKTVKEPLDLEQAKKEKASPETETPPDQEREQIA